jgi:hypothetical protein
MSYVTGYVLQELLALSASQPAAQQPAEQPWFPLVFGADHALAALSSDDLFDASVELLLSGLSAPT